MTSIFDEAGKNIPCTVIEAGPCVVTQIRSVETDGYAAVQLAYGEQKDKHTTGPLKAISKKPVLHQNVNWLNLKLSRNQKLRRYHHSGYLPNKATLSTWWVHPKGKGFQGVVKRHGFGGVGMQTHVA